MKTKSLELFGFNFLLAIKWSLISQVNLYVGKTINRQAFDTQFVLDMSYALNIDPNRIYVIHVDKGTVVSMNFLFKSR